VKLRARDPEDARSLGAGSFRALERALDEQRRGKYDEHVGVVRLQ
jgi:hypothetical protein